MQKIWFSLLVTAGVLFSNYACFYDSEEELYGTTGGCDTTNIRYSVEVQTLLQNNCYSCHTVNSNVSGFPFETYETLLPYAQNGQLVSRINDAGNPMPPTGLLPDCDREKIEAWVNAGAPKN